MIAGHCWHTVNRADKVGEELREQLRAVQKSHPKLIKEVRGRGLLNAVVLHQAGLGKASAYDVCIGLKNRGILAKLHMGTSFDCHHLLLSSTVLTFQSTFRSFFCGYYMFHECLIFLSCSAWLFCLCMQTGTSSSSKQGI